MPVLFIFYPWLGNESLFAWQKAAVSLDSNTMPLHSHHQALTPFLTTESERGRERVMIGWVMGDWSIFLWTLMTHCLWWWRWVHLMVTECLIAKHSVCVPCYHCIRFQWQFIAFFQEMVKEMVNKWNFCHLHTPKYVCLSLFYVT